MSVGNPYEIRCESCQVSFPPGTKTCIHCGGRLGGGLSVRRPGPQRPGALGRSRQRAITRSAGDANDDFFPKALQDEIDPHRFDEPEEPDASAPGRAIRVGVNVLWIIGAVLITVLQMCRSGA
jgi:hypothetical protein